jgi:single-strand DNA-binding protein
MQMNRIEIAGYLKKKPEVRYLPSGTPVANARLGQSYRYQDSNQKWVEHTNWHSLSFYGDLANLALNFDKGENLYIEGSIEQREFTPKDGSIRTINEVIVRRCHVIAPAKQTAAATNAASSDSSPRETVPTGESDHDDDWPVR